MWILKELLGIIGNPEKVPILRVRSRFREKMPGIKERWGEA